MNVGNGSIDNTHDDRTQPAEAVPSQDAQSSTQEETPAQVVPPPRRSSTTKPQAPEQQQQQQQQTVISHAVAQSQPSPIPPTRRPIFVPRSSVVVIADPVFDILYIEMVRGIMAQVASKDVPAAMETVFFKLEEMGYRVGQRMVDSLTCERNRFTDTLEIVKFICKDFWVATFKKQIDNLKTNHKGVFVLQDSKFKWLTRMSGPTNSSDAAEKIAPFLAFPCGVIRGALANLGVIAVVNASAKLAELPMCVFEIKMDKTVAA